MSSASRAAVTNGAGSFAVDVIDVDGPGSGEVLVSIRAAGICHTDHDFLAATVPIVLGHEGAGVVEAVGEGVTTVGVGDRVVLTWAIRCGTCFQCYEGNEHLCERLGPLTSPLGHALRHGTRRHGEPLRRAFDLGTLSTLTVVREEALVPIPDTVPFTAAAIAGCAVMTGFGSAVNAAKVRPGSAVVVLGCGGVGLNVIQGARLSGATLVIAVDTRPTRLRMAEEFGAHVVLRSDPTDHELSAVVERVRELTGGRGTDYAFECTGVPDLGDAPLRLVRNAGVAVQVSGIERPITIDMTLFEWDKTYINPLYGQCRPRRDFTRMFDLYVNGDLMLDELVTRTYTLDDLQAAFDDMLAGRNAKGVIVFDPDQG